MTSAILLSRWTSSINCDVWVFELCKLEILTGENIHLQDTWIENYADKCFQFVRPLEDYPKRSELNKRSRRSLDSQDLLEQLDKPRRLPYTIKFLEHLYTLSF
jgi:hypothetical protein